jgi:hypothetical protein
MRLAATILTVCLLRSTTAPALEAPDASDWCIERMRSLAARRAELAAQLPEIKAGMATVFARLEADVDSVADRAPALKQRMVDMKPTADDPAHWQEFRQFFRQIAEPLQALGRGVPAWDIGIFSSLERTIIDHENLSSAVRNDEVLYNASCIDPSRGASARAIADALHAKGVKEPEVFLYMNLATEFRTKSSWALAFVREKVPGNPGWEVEGPLVVCFLKEQSPACLDAAGIPKKVDVTDLNGPDVFLEARVVYAGAGRQKPRLLVKTCTQPSGDGDCGIHTTLYAYDDAADRFDQMFHNVTARNRNELTRFVEDGPIRSDIIVTVPTDDRPHAYWVEVHRQQADGQYARILRYRGRTGYADGNRLAVADSEMPEVLRRLGLWKSGDPLPVPAKLPAGCTNLVLRGGVEWCK